MSNRPSPCPVSHEEVAITREPVTDANRDSAEGGPSISEEEHEVVLHAEKSVVATGDVAVEPIALCKETVTENQQVSGEAREERVEVDQAGDVGKVTDQPRDQ